jgi:hypothetical protein
MLAVMNIPFMLSFASEAKGEQLVIPGRYDSRRGLRVVDTDSGPRPLVCSDFAAASLLTKTDARPERDDEGRTLGLLTKTEHRRERDDEDVMLATLTKTASGETDFDDCSS